ncbi:MAG: hypothetical protein GXP55_15985 [Deltaproteobacteria bacterium]|nr:hypothetical protein [Deltaproteobacteria bacterium]
MNESLRRFLELITGWLDAANIPYMLAGSFASTLHGRPRSTQDVDLVIDPTEHSIREFVGSIPPERGYVDLSAALTALRARDMFNVIDLDTGWKADLIVRKARRFSVREFERRRRAEWQGLSVYVASPEDVVLSKLEWCRLSGGSQRQLADVAGVVAALGEQLDVQYIEQWLDPLRVRTEWAQVKGE